MRFNISSSESNITYVKSISTTVSTIVMGLAIIGAVAIAATVIVITGGFAGLAMGAGAAAGAGVILGGIAAEIITSNQYNLQFNRIATTIEVISSCVIAGIIAAGVAYCSCGKSMDVGSKNKIGHQSEVNKQSQIQNTITDEEYNNHTFQFDNTNIALTADEKNAVIKQTKLRIETMFKQDFKNLKKIIAYKSNNRVTFCYYLIGGGA